MEKGDRLRLNNEFGLGLAYQDLDIGYGDIAIVRRVDEESQQVYVNFNGTLEIWLPMSDFVTDKEWLES